MHLLKVILVGACSLALIWLLMVWVLAPSGVTNPYLPNFLQRAPEPPARNPAQKAKMTKAPEPEEQDLPEDNEPDTPEANATRHDPLLEEKPDPPEVAETSTPAKAEPKPVAEAKPPKPPALPADLEDRATLTRILALAIDDREMVLRTVNGHERLLQDDEPFTGWAKRMRGNSGQVEYLGQYRDGLKDGPYARWYSGRRFRDLIHYRKGIRNGLSVTWYGSRNKRDAIHYENDIKHGPATTWFGSGKKSAVGHYKHGEKDGVWITFKSSGKENRRQAYQNGNPLDE